MKMVMPPKGRTILPPEGGWEAQSFYAVHVAGHPSNPVWGAIFFTGFLDDTEPGGYSTILSPTTDRPLCLNDLHYLKVLHKLDVPHGHIREEDPMDVLMEMVDHCVEPSPKDGDVDYDSRLFGPFARALRVLGKEGMVKILLDDGKDGVCAQKVVT